MAMHDVPPGITNPPRRNVDPAAEGDHKTPGTLVLAFVFLTAFVVYYFVNWKLLSALWRIQ